jgi:hypothetical protein
VRKGGVGRAGGKCTRRLRVYAPADADPLQLRSGSRAVQFLLAGILARLRPHERSCEPRGAGGRGDTCVHRAITTQCSVASACLTVVRDQVFVGNLPPEAEARDLRDFFRDFGQINDAWVARKPPGFGFVWFDDERDAVLPTSESSSRQPRAPAPCRSAGPRRLQRPSDARLPFV